jgi:ketosteroid isomerase-like protein
LVYAEHAFALEGTLTNTALLKNLYDEFGRGNVPAVLGTMSPDIHWYSAEGNPYRPTGEVWIGPEAVLNNLFMKIMADWDGFAVHPKVFHDAGHSVIVEVRYTGTVKATGKSVDAQACHIWDVKDGKVTKFQQYLDTAKLQDAFKPK